KELRTACGDDVQSACAVLPDAVDHVSVAVRFQRAGGIEIDGFVGAAAADCSAGGDAGRTGIAGHDRGVLFGQHVELFVHDPAECGGFCDLRVPGPAVFASDAASIEHRPASGSDF